MKKFLLILVALAFIAGFLSAQKIAVIVKTGNSSFWQNVQTGCFDAQKELKAARVKAATGSDSGNIAVMSYVAGVGSEIGRVGGFKDYIAKNSWL